MVQEFYPGFYRPKAHLLGNYYGIFNDGKLVAVTGECFQNEDFFKLSAVVTNIAFTGRIYAQQLMTFVNNKLFQTEKFRSFTLTRKIQERFPLTKNWDLPCAKKVKIYYFRENKNTRLSQS